MFASILVPITPYDVLGTCDNLWLLFSGKKTNLAKKQCVRQHDDTSEETKVTRCRRTEEAPQVSAIYVLVD